MRDYRPLLTRRETGSDAEGAGRRGEGVGGGGNPGPASRDGSCHVRAGGAGGGGARARGLPAAAEGGGAEPRRDRAEPGGFVAERGRGIASASPAARLRLRAAFPRWKPLPPHRGAPPPRLRRPRALPPLSAPVVPWRCCGSFAAVWWRCHGSVVAVWERCGSGAAGAGRAAPRFVRHEAGGRGVPHAGGRAGRSRAGSPQRCSPGTLAAPRPSAVSADIWQAAAGGEGGGWVGSGPAGRSARISAT